MKPRIVHIRDTMRLEEIEISEGMLEEARANPMIEILDEPRSGPLTRKGTSGNGRGNPKPHGFDLTALGPLGPVIKCCRS